MHNIEVPIKPLAVLFLAQLFLTSQERNEGSLISDAEPKALSIRWMCFQKDVSIERRKTERPRDFAGPFG